MNPTNPDDPPSSSSAPIQLPPSPAPSPPSTSHLLPLPSLTSKLHLFPYTHPTPTSPSTPPPLPARSRIDPRVLQKEPPLPLSRVGVKGLLGWAKGNWKDVGWFLGMKGWDVGWSLIKYGVWGPPRPSWGIEMTTIAALMRNLGQHSSLADITLIRNFISVHHLLPLPPDAIVTPVRFEVKRRRHVGDDEEDEEDDDEEAGHGRGRGDGAIGQGLKGFLEQLDSEETGHRTLSGEWVVNKSVWRRLRTEAREREMVRKQRRRERDAGVSVGKSALGEKKGKGETGKGKEEKVIYYIHGGAYYVGQATTHRTITIALSKHCNCRVFAINYRLAPEVRFPEPLLDVVYGYLRLVEDLRIQPKNIIVMGDSAGGGLSLALVMYLRDAGYQNLLPRGMVLMSPWVDLTMSCGSWDENAEYDVVPIPGQEDHLNPVSCYLGPEGIKKYLTHPYASPLFGDFAGLPPMLVQAGDAECLRDEITLLAHKATLAGVQVQHELHIDQVHVFQSFPFLESSGVAFRSIAKFFQGLKDPKSSVLPTSRKRENAAAQDVQQATALPSISRSDTPVEEDTIGSEMAHGETKLVKGDGTEVDITQAKDDDAEDTEDKAEEMLQAEIDREDEEEEQRDSLSPLMQTLATLPSFQDEQDEMEDQTGSVHGSGSITQQGTSTSTIIPASTNTTPQKPFIRRALSGFTRARPESPQLSRRTSGSSFFSFSAVKPPLTTSTSSSNIVNSSEAFPTSPSWPQPMLAGSTRIQHRPTISHHLTRSPVVPTTRARSQSHSDMISLVNGYSRGGAANSTVVFSPGSTKGGAMAPEQEMGEEGLPLPRQQQQHLQQQPQPLQQNRQHQSSRSQQQYGSSQLPDAFGPGNESAQQSGSLGLQFQ